MGVVWLARDDRLDRLVAFKLVPDAVCFDASAQEDLKRETRKSLLLTHPNIVRIFDFVEDERTRRDLDGVRRWRDAFRPARAATARSVSR